MKYLDCFQIKYTVLKKAHIGEKISEKAIFIFLNEDERRGGQCVYRIAHCESDDQKKDALVKRGGAKLTTYRSLLVQIMEDSWLEELGIKKPANRSVHIVNDKADILLSALKEKGVACFCLYEDEEDFTEYGRNFRNEVSERMRISTPNLRKPWPQKKENEAFYGELYQIEDYEKEIAQKEIFNALDTYQYKKSVTGKYFNANGRRTTCFQPDDYIGTIYILGMCVVIGSHVEDQYTIPSYLQKRLLEKGYKYRVENYGDMVRPDAAIDSRLEEIGRFHAYDIVIYMSYLWKTVNISEKSLEKIFEENQIPSEWVKDTYGHCNHKVNKIIADSMLDMLEPCLLNGPKEDNAQTVQINIHDIMTEYVRQKYLDLYFPGFSGSKYNTVGAIVMVGNCFNKGHRYLIEQAKLQVEFLIIFVVEEDSFLFPFEERFKLIEEGTRDLTDVMVVPSGDFILSRKTFPQFFSKGERDAVVFNAEYDINAFADYIAKPLHITHRFAGEEPKKKIVKAYNETMERILPQKGITYTEFPRLVIDDMVISTAGMRKYLRNSEYDKAFALLPETTKQYLMKQLGLTEED